MIKTVNGSGETVNKSDETVITAVNESGEKVSRSVLPFTCFHFLSLVFTFLHFLSFSTYLHAGILKNETTANTDSKISGGIYYTQSRAARAPNSAETGTEFKLAVSTQAKMFTPNGDGKNDEINLIFTGNVGAITDAEIFDITGKRIGTMIQKSDLWFVWNGKNDDGRTVLPGLYIYQVKNGDKVFNGIVVVAR